jgi:hypothetical protein
MLETQYTDITISSIAANGKGLSFSSDTGIAECLVVARKAYPEEIVDERVQFVSLRDRPPSFAHSAGISGAITRRVPLRGIDDGPYGGTGLSLGNEPVGEMITGFRSGAGDGWGGVRLSDYSVAQTAYALSNSRLWLPAQTDPAVLFTAVLGKVGHLGFYHLDISGPPPRAPFAREEPSVTATYPCLWGHDAQKETRFVCGPDCELRVRPNLEAKAANVWRTASRSHLNRDFRFNSQPLAVAHTERVSVGGRGWPNVRFADERFDFAFCLWSNSTLGFLCYWWHANKQQDGRGITSIRAAESLSVLDFRTLTNQQLSTAETIFDEFRDKDFQPAHLADADPNRAHLDHRVVCDLLGFDEDIYRAVRRLSAKWCAEPSVHGGKARPKSARLVV